MLGAIAGDMIGSVFEKLGYEGTFKRVFKEYTLIDKNQLPDFPLFTKYSKFTDDTMMTIAVADWILNQGDLPLILKKYGRMFPNAGYGGNFLKWLLGEDTLPYYSFGNGSGMRVSPVGFAYNTLEEVLEKAEQSAAVTHNHPEGIKGAQAVASAIFLARGGNSKQYIKDYIQQTFAYNLDRTLYEIRPNYQFDVSCQGSVPESIISFLESENVEDAIRKAISLGGDTDTMACIAGAIAQAYYRDIPIHIVQAIKERLPSHLWEIVEKFENQYGTIKSL
ncbi:MAG: ADP-ribosylglycohydrolase family protein [Thermoflexibacter sp.]|jgi:ADP-ribosylglycohydrolase|nr:ADP-ribosylglycohydrolase family protein [Thermoflexibacter sp.]